MSWFGWRKSNPWLAWLGIIGAGIAAAPLIWLGIRAVLASTPYVTLQPRLQEACRVCSGAPLDGTKPYRIGRLLVVQPSGIPIGQIMADESLAGITAPSKNTIGTLVCVGEPVSVRIGTASCGTPLYRQYREVCLIDYATQRVLYRTNLAGSQPTFSG
ncbi:MAG: hypothetical protein LLG44_00715 [Chloroflexi bacterium]|nr:hypothetical protein [Chloroflexota bacterium]